MSGFLIYLGLAAVAVGIAVAWQIVEIVVGIFQARKDNQH